MDARQLAKIAAELKSLRQRGGVSCRELEAVATQLGRVYRNSGGSHGQWSSTYFPALRLVTIPRHSGDLKTGLKQRIIAQLEEDVAMWEGLSE
jgi:predicted RNA binding protein YcfA (HicA-like mRNA interferase family)